MLFELIRPCHINVRSEFSRKAGAVILEENIFNSESVLSCQLKLSLRRRFPYLVEDPTQCQGDKCIKLYNEGFNYEF